MPMAGGVCVHKCMMLFVINPNILMRLEEWIRINVARFVAITIFKVALAVDSRHEERNWAGPAEVNYACLTIVTRQEPETKLICFLGAVQIVI